ncbi:MAG: DEAD/DEAH box helicase, partial [Rhodocyclaceae bacterium]|nr:DEAD/DEAH box helicase [Rhodocyclaceae bacterium]
MTFRELGIPEAFDATLARMGLVLPTPIQTQAIPLLLAGGDLIAGAPTGTGKTAAFLLPALVRMLKPASVRARGPRVLVLTPTRELAQQVNRAAFELSRDLPRVKSVCITGGESYVNQNRLLSSPHEILVATPGRLMDQMQSGRVDFSRLEVLVLDEADRMLDMGFSDDVLAIARALPAERQTVCFTATISQSVHDLSRQLQR